MSYYNLILTIRTTANQHKTGPAKMLDLNKGLRDVTFHMTGGNRVAQGRVSLPDRNTRCRRLRPTTDISLSQVIGFPTNAQEQSAQRSATR